MFCPKCATENLDGARFCRGCGANISLIPQALTGRMPAAIAAEDESHADSSQRRRRGEKGPSLEKAVKNIFLGIAFLLISLVIFMTRDGNDWWWVWLLIPSFALLGGGIAEYLRLKQEQRSAASLPLDNVMAAPSVAALPQRQTAELIPSPSVTEGTTRHLVAERPTRHFEEKPFESKSPDL